MSSEMPSNWQNELMREIEDVEHKMEDAKLSIGNKPRVLEDYQKALGSVRTAKEDVSHFIGVFNDESRD